MTVGVYGISDPVRLCESKKCSSTSRGIAADERGVTAPPLALYREVASVLGFIM